MKRLLAALAIVLGLGVGQATPAASEGLTCLTAPGAATAIFNRYIHVSMTVNHKQHPYRTILRWEASKPVEIVIIDTSTGWHAGFEPNLGGLSGRIVMLGDLVQLSYCYYEVLPVPFVDRRQAVT